MSLQGVVTEANRPVEVRRLALGDKKAVELFVRLPWSLGMKADRGYWRK